MENLRKLTNNLFLFQIDYFDVFYVFAAAKDAILQLRPLLSQKKLLVSVAAGVKLKDLQVRLLSFCGFIIIGVMIK